MNPGRTDSSPDGRRRGILLAALACLAFILLFALRASEQTADSLDYALAARTARGMFHPHHLLFTPIVRLLGLVLAFLSPSPDSIVAGQIHNLLWAVTVLVATQVVAREILGADTGAFLAALGLLVCRGFWLYSTQLEVYVPAMGCLALIASILVRCRDRQLSLRQHLVLAGLLAMAVFYHQANLIFCVPLAYYLMAGGRKDRRGLVVIFGLAGLAVLSGYVAAFRFSDANQYAAASLGLQAERGIRGFLRFCLTYAYHPSPGWGTWRNVGVMGAGRLVHSQLRDITTFPWSLRFVAIPGFALSLALLFGWHLRQALTGRTNDVTRRFLVIWLATHYAFYLWWFPGEKEFFIIPLVPLALLLALLGRDLLEDRRPSPGRRRMLLAAALSGIGLLGLSNAGTTILPYHRSRGPAYQDAALLASRVPADCVAVVDYAVGQNLRYYFDRPTFVEAQMPLFYFYRREPLPERYRLDGRPCLVADLALVSPAYALGDLNAYDRPDEWLRYFEWAFGFEFDGKGELVASRAFEIVGAPDTGVYVWLHPPVRVTGGLGPLFGRLDGEWAARVEGGGRPFSSWLARTGR
ncbi:MAG TPA: DUF2723 domain-containing protein [Candidatus Polarisedimenticolia bacterium]|nr:DUF2723 domain-containing protein [Candidatus Polarisedimenticolia bacterium]